MKPKSLRYLMDQCFEAYNKAQRLENEIFRLFSDLDIEMQGTPHLADMITTYLNYNDIEWFDSYDDLIKFLNKKLREGRTK